MKPIRIEKRIPFGFRGDWGKLYKKYNYDELVKDVVQWNKTAYYDIGQDVQFKFMENSVDARTIPSQLVDNYVVKGNYRIAETTDSYFDDRSGEFECVVEIGDIIFLRGRWYAVDDIESRNIYAPQRHSFYYAALKRIEEEVIQTERG